MKHIKGWFICFFWTTISFGQVDTVLHFPQTIKGFEMDDMGNYFVYSAHDLQIFTSELKVKGKFSADNFSEITAIDLFDPLKIGVFFRDNQRYLSINQFGAEVGDGFDLYDEFPNGGISHICKTGFGSYRVFDPLKQQIVEMDQFFKGKVCNELSITMNSRVDVDQFIYYDQKVYLTVKDIGVFVFDRYCSTIAKMNTPIEKIRPTEGGFYFLDSNDAIYYYDQRSYETLLVCQETTHVKDFFVQNGKVYLLIENTLVERLMK